MTANDKQVRLASYFNKKTYNMNLLDKKLYDIIELIE